MHWLDSHVQSKALKEMPKRKRNHVTASSASTVASTEANDRRQEKEFLEERVSLDQLSIKNLNDRKEDISKKLDTIRYV